MRLKDLGTVSPADIRVGGDRAAQVFGINRAVGIQHLAVAHGHLRAGRRGNFQPDEADHVLAEIKRPAAGFRLRQALRPDLADPPHLLGHLTFQGSRCFLTHGDGLPRTVIQAGGIPPLHLEPGIVVLPKHEIRGTDGTSRRLP